ncbi:hypothetical protein PTQ33_00275 [Campylobacter sp. 50012-21]|uniref:HK97-gp10 family putative phage morphogenesis protein n=1 Tax=Campylobacter magnus TaxID=3026462 RepID=UPI00235E85D8|nr:HK97-gp10 family putative phage morphogenesis protein [Campylobacter magnus]MDD0845563.1 hypothetical protein [Campylobacter magnus]
MRKIRKVSRKSYERMKLKGKKVYLAGYSSTGRAQLSAFYGHFVEYGTKKMSARPFMRPATGKAKGYMKEVPESHISAMNAELGAS